MKCMPTITSDHTGYRSHNGIGLFNLMNMNFFITAWNEVLVWNQQMFLLKVMQNKAGVVIK